MTISNASRSVTGTVFIYLFYAVAFGLPWLRPQWHGILVGLLVLSWLFTKGPLNIVHSWRDAGILLVFTGVFFVDCIGMSYTNNISYGKAYLETEIPLLLFPIIILSSARLLTPTTIRNIVIAFIAGVITLNLASLGFISQHLWDPQRLEANVVIAHNSIVRIHPVFLSVYISFALFFLIGTYFPLKALTRDQLGWVLFSCSVLLVYLVWMNSRVGFAGFLVAALFYATTATGTGVRIYAYCGIVVVIALLVLLPFSRERFYDAPKHVVHFETQAERNDINARTIYFRSEIYGCSFDMLQGNAFLSGYGTGDFKDVLLDCYKRNDLKALLDKQLDAHSEYFAQLHRTGIAGLSFFLMLIIVPFYFAMRYRSSLYGAFLILFAVTALFETILSSQKGVTFFLMFSPLLFLLARQEYEGRQSKTSSLNNIS